MAQLGDLTHLLRARRVTLSLLAAVTLFAATSQHLFDLGLPVSYSPSVPVGAIAIAVWCALVWQSREATRRELHALGERRVIAEAAFRNTVTAFLLPTSADDEPEAEVLRDGLLRRHIAILAARDALDAGHPVESDPTVTSHTSPHERGEATGRALLERLATLQREALAASQRAGFLGEHRTGQLDAQLETLTSKPRPHALREPALSLALKLLTAGYALVLPLVSAQRIASALVAALGSTALVLLEAASQRDR